MFQQPNPCCPPDVPPPNETTRQQRTQLVILMVGHFLFSIVKLVLGINFISDLFCAIILCCAFRPMNFCLMAVYSIMVLLQVIYALFFLGGELQSQVDFRDSTIAVATAVSAGSIAFYCYAMFLSFKAYREYKALLKEGAIPMGMNGGFGGFGGFGLRGGLSRGLAGTGMRNQEMREMRGYGQQPVGYQQNEHRGFQAFGGQGVVIGGRN